MKKLILTSAALVIIQSLLFSQNVVFSINDNGDIFQNGKKIGRVVKTTNGNFMTGAMPEFTVYDVHGTARFLFEKTEGNFIFLDDNKSFLPRKADAYVKQVAQFFASDSILTTRGYNVAYRSSFIKKHKGFDFLDKKERDYNAPVGYMGKSILQGEVLIGNYDYRLMDNTKDVLVAVMDLNKKIVAYISIPGKSGLTDLTIQDQYQQTIKVFKQELNSTFLYRTGIEWVVQNGLLGKKEGEPSQVQSSQSQTVRFLEKKGFEEKKVDLSSQSRLSVSANEASTKLAVSSFETEDMKRFTTYAKILNLLDGHLEFNSPAFQLQYVGNDLLYTEYTADSGRLIKAGNMQTKSYFIDPETEAKTEIPLPDGYHLTGYQGRFVFTTNFQKLTSIILEKTPEGFRKKHELKLINLRLSGDGSMVLGRTSFASNTISAYSVENGELITTLDALINIKKPKQQMFIVPALYSRLKNGNWVISGSDTYELTRSKIANEMHREGFHVYVRDLSGNVLFKLKDAGMFYELNEKEDQLISVNEKGSIRLWELATGKLLTEVTDAHITLANSETHNSANSNKKTSPPVSIAKGKFYLIGYSNGIVSLFHTAQQKVVANLFFDGPDWAVIAKDGRIDGTAGAFEKLEWREYDGDKLVSQTSLESTFDKYYTPRLLYSIISGESTATVRQNIDSDIRKVPTLAFEKIGDEAFAVTKESYSSDQKNITLKLRVTSNADRVKEVRLYQNGKLVGLQNGNGSANYTISVSLNSSFGEVNYLYAIASSTDGVDSEKCKLIVNYKGAGSNKAKLYALVIGINQYQNPRYALNYAQPDAEAVKKQLEASKSALFESIEVKTLFGEKVTKAGIVNAFKELSAVIKEQDIFVFYFAGHGTMNDDPVAREFYIVPYDVTQLYGNEVALKDKALSASEIKKLSMKLNAQKQVFIIDACHSAEALNSAVTRGAAEEKAIGQLARSTGTFWLTAAGSDQFATEFEQIGHGVFTFSLLEALQGKDFGSMADGTITVRELSSYVEQRVPELSQKYKGKPQYPASFSFGNDFPLLMFSKDK